MTAEDAVVQIASLPDEVYLVSPEEGYEVFKTWLAGEGWELLEAAGRKRGYLVSGGEVNTERMAKVLLDEYRSGKLGKFTLEMPEEVTNG